MAKILVCEDDKLISGSLVEVLKTAGYETDMAFDGEEALKKIKEIQPDLVLLDILMPKLDGISVLWELKANPESSKVPVVVLTNVGDVETISKIVEAGAVDYLLKSDQSMDDIVQKVKDVLSRDIKLS
ncbi:MAG: response regulator [Candidatus Doudnabacteria bacterium CG10_big_fil_rev_8_21_14_0_10_42_18]|uniref:Response regulator n=1 Tax=Candidatus Doudnabacteria bacterium CG10_big_fil_rev_8_21_14_0_10_42_18 TaxID=1974552 RepID=A0A2H0VBS3_9BACT|nr:MAG: response regulator [Candidatus Doudnabacteria bacterium CG10_big_fil_rev_8_21_14_0_10_42_18]